MKYTPGGVEGEHVILTGPIQGVVELDDGTVIDVSPGFIEADPELHAEIAAKIGERYAAEGHPDDVEIDSETGERVQREFVYVSPEQQAAAENEK